MSVKDQPHHQLAAQELAEWLEKQGRRSWWSVDGDPLLMGRVSFPCSAEDLAKAIRNIGKPLLVQDLGGGGTVRTDDLGRFAEVDDSDNRVFVFSWDVPGAATDWLLVEDREAALVAGVMEA